MNGSNAALQSPSPATALSIELVKDLAGLEQLKAAWIDLETRCAAAPSVFQSFDWCFQWAKSYASPSAVDPVELHILLGYQAAKLVFILPLIRRHNQGVKLLCWLTDPHGQYGDILCDKDEDAADWMKSALEFCTNEGKADIIYLRHVRVNANLSDFAQSQMTDAQLNEQAPYLDLSAFKTNADYDDRYTSTQKKRRKKIRKALEDLGPVNFKTLDQPNAIDQAIATSISEKNAWLKERGRYNRVMGCPNHVEFLQSLARLENHPLELVVTELSAGDTPASWDINFRYRGTNYCYITSHVNALSDLSPGRLHMDQSQRASLSAGMHTFDLMVPNDKHKDSWCSGKINVNDYYYPLNAKGRLFGAAYLSWLRPLLRKAYYNLPQKALLAIQPLVR